MKVLLNVDVLNDFCPGGALAVPEGDRVVKPTNELLSSGLFDFKIAVHEAHPEGHVSYVTTHPGHVLYEALEINGITQVLWPEHCRDGTWGAEFHPDLQINLFDMRFKKGTAKEIDSYSAFFDNGRVRETGLREIILAKAQELGIPISEIEIFVCGLATDYCVRGTALDAAELGFKTSVIVDACRAVNLKPDDETRVLRELVAKGVTLTTTCELLAARELELTNHAHSKSDFVCRPGSLLPNQVQP